MSQLSLRCTSCRVAFQVFSLSQLSLCCLSVVSRVISQVFSLSQLCLSCRSGAGTHHVSVAFQVSSLSQLSLCCLSCYLAGVQLVSVVSQLSVVSWCPLATLPLAPALSPLTRTPLHRSQ